MNNIDMANDIIEQATTAKDTDLAATLRDIAASCDKTTGKILRMCTKAANDGECSLVVKVHPEDREYLYVRENSTKAYEDWMVRNYPRELAALRTPPLIERLESLGFKLESTTIVSWYNDQRTIKISW